MNPQNSRPDWQLPLGVPQANWQYTQTRSIAEDYDHYFRDHGLLEFDREILANTFSPPGTIVDLGCGTGRALIPLADRGFRGVGVDLSQPMLTVLHRKATAAKLPIAVIRGNLVELQFLADASMDGAICLFSTLGMIQGHEHRQQAVRHMTRVLRPGARFVLHVHNIWNCLWMPQGRGWLLKNWLASMFGRANRGDRCFDYRGIRDFQLHVFHRREIEGLCVDAGLIIDQWHFIDSRGDRRLPLPWLLGNWRAQGWILVGHRPQSV